MEQQANNRHSLIVDDATLIRGILDGHIEHFRTLADRYAQDVQWFVGRVIHQAEDAEDVTQDAMVAVYQSLSRYDASKACFRTWILRIAYHTALKRLRNESHMQWVDADDDNLEIMSDRNTLVLQGDTSPTRLELLQQAVEQLSTDDQMLISLYYNDDRSLREISYIVDHPESYLASRLQWIRKKICKTIITLERNGER